ncbi:hypothetical protein SMMN14_08848 [Sphaerulina musiva]
MTHRLDYGQTQVQVCTCMACRSLHDARVSLSYVRIDDMVGSHVERDATNLVVHADRLLSTGYSLLQQHHILARSSPQLSRQHQQPVVGPRHEPDDVFTDRPLLAPGNDEGSPSGSLQGNPATPMHSAQIGDAHHMAGRGGSTAAPNHEEDVAFKNILRHRAAELGILRSTAKELPPPVTPPFCSATMTARTQPEYDALKGNKFIVCDHCRSHGIRCNEAAVCNECIYREVCCTHRRCELSPASREDCPRTVCFYVHEDWMPDLNGQHNPTDENWIVLPGRIREHLSAGQLTRINSRTEGETRRYHGGVLDRQLHAKKEIRRLVAAGEATWENFNMTCRCREIEFKEEKNKAIEMQMRRMAISRIGRQSSI